MTSRGEKNHWAKLDEDKVREIRALFVELTTKGVSERQSMLRISSKFNTTPSNVFYIITRKTWSNVE